VHFERRHEPLIPLSRFVRRLASSFAIGQVLVAISLAIGMVGYHRLFSLPWIDAFVNAAMILSGMGPLAEPESFGAKLFSGLYALYSGLAVLAIAGVIFAPAVHRFLHYLHADPDETRDAEPAPRRRGARPGSGS
jgi:Co/Zn/Cd efflux system component